MSDVIEAATPIGVRTLTKADRCDKCQAEAFVIAVFAGGGELLFCLHHGRENQVELERQALVVKSYEDTINRAPSPSANVA